MTQFVTPIDTARDTFESIIQTKLGATIRVYDHMPTDGARPECVVIQHIGTMMIPWGGGDNQTATVKARFVIIRLQVDVWTNTESQRDSWSDQIMEALWDNRQDMKDNNHIYNCKLIEGRDLPPPEPYSRIYRKTMRFDVTSEITDS